jgi:biopolymer transport protein ExbB
LTPRSTHVIEVANHSHLTRHAESAPPLRRLYPLLARCLVIERLTQLMVQSGAAWVLWLLFGLSAASLAIAIERAWVFRRTRGDVAALVPKLRRLLRDEPEQAAKLLEGSACVEAQVVAAGLVEAERGAAAAEQAMAAAMGLSRKRLERRLLFLGTIGNNAPFVGLLGTVIGVVGAFQELGKPQALSSTVAEAGSLAPERVMGTIAEALVATAVGLVVAIPAVALFNYFQGRVAAALADAETLGHVLLAHLRGQEPAHRERVSQTEAAAAAE